MKKPAINRTFPPDRGAWEAMVENMEILTGRRGDKLTPPKLSTLTFSAAPTQAEVTALYQYVNRLEGLLAALVTRLDA